MDDRATKLLLKAVRLLPEREQDQVFSALLKGSGAVPIPFNRPIPGPGSGDMLMLAGAGPMLPPPIEMSGPVAMLPVRLPPELHERLRAWSNEHGFSMASVVRGLVERFLDEQGGKASRRAPGGAKPKGKGKRATAGG